MRKGWVRELGGVGWVIWMGESSLPYIFVSSVLFLLYFSLHFSFLSYMSTRTTLTCSGVPESVSALHDAS